MSTQDIWPTEIRVLEDKRVLEIAWEDGRRDMIAAELARVESPSAEVQGHGPNDKTTVPGKRDVTIAAVEPVGSYAVRIVFSDGHDTGIFTWDYLRKLGQDGKSLMDNYIAALSARGLSRDRGF